MSLSLQTLLVVAVTAMFTGVGTGAGVALGTWIISRHLINRIDKEAAKK